MNNTIDTHFKEDVNILYGIKTVFKSEQYVSLIKTKLDYTDDLKKILFDETDNCLEVYEKFIKPTMDNYINDKITNNEINEMMTWNFNSPNTLKKEYFNKIFPQLVNLLINNIDKLDSDKEKYNELIIIKPKPKTIILSDSDNEDEIKKEIINETVDETSDESDNESVDEENIKDEPEITDLDLWDHDVLRKPFDFRDNQKKAINNTIEQNFQSGIHCQIMGAGKTFIMLNIIYQHYLKYNKNLIYIILTDKIEILKSWFMINLTDKIKKDYIKKTYLKTYKKLISDNIFKTKEFLNYEKTFNIKIFETKEYLTYEAGKIKNNSYYNVTDNKTPFTFNYDRFQKWTDDEIIDMTKFEITENIINKDSSIINSLNKNLDSPTIWICNNGFLKSKNKYKKLNYNNIGLVLVDECHSVSGRFNYEMLEFIRNKGTNIIGFSATPLRPFAIAEKQLLNVYGTSPSEEPNQLNVISNYDMIQALNDGVVLPFVHTIISPVTDKNSLKINSPNKQELTLRKIIEDYFINNKDLPYKKGVVWVNSISKIAKDNGEYYKEIKSICGDKIKLYVSYSGNSINPEVNEISSFEDQESNALLLCVNRVKEGSDIKNLDCGIFLDAVKSRSIISSLQSIGRIMRPDEKKLKKFAHIIECIKVDEHKTVESITVGKVLNYYKKILNISSLSNQNNYLNKIQRLFDETEIINEDGQKSIEIVINHETNIRCKINLNIKQIDWRIFQDALRKELCEKLNIKEDDLLEREFTKLKHSVRKLNFTDKVKYKEYAKNNKLEELPELKYKNWWKNYYEFLGIDISKYPKNKEDLIKICVNNKINTEKEYYEKSVKYDLPVMPEQLYINFTTLYNELDIKRNRRK